METGKLLILSGPSGVGKDTVIDAWKATNPRVNRVVAYTTRPPRANERHGVDYHFVTRAEFEERAASEDFLEYKLVHENYYATPKSEVDRLLDLGLIAILKIDVQGALTVMDLRPEALSVFILPPNADELIRRIRERGTEDPEAVIQRLRTAEAEMRLADRYQYRLINDEVDRLVDELEHIVAR